MLGVGMWFHLSLLSPARFLYKEQFEWDMRRSQSRLANNILYKKPLRAKSGDELLFSVWSDHFHLISCLILP